MLNHHPDIKLLVFVTAFRCVCILFKGLRKTVPFPPQYGLEHRPADFSVKSQRVNILGFMGHTVPVATTYSAWLCESSWGQQELFTQTGDGLEWACQGWSADPWFRICCLEPSCLSSNLSSNSYLAFLCHSFLICKIGEMELCPLRGVAVGTK